MTLKDVRDKLSKMFIEDRSLESKEINHILIEDVDGFTHFDYMLRDDNEDSDIEEDDDYEYDDESDDYDYEDEDDDEESWESDDDDSDLEESY